MTIRKNIKNDVKYFYKKVCMLHYDLHIHVPLELSFYFLFPMEWDPVWLYVAWEGGIRLYCELEGWTRYLG